MAVARSGYDLPVYGLASGAFPYIHGAALSCITCSLLCALATIAWSWHANRGRFSDWSPGDRMVVYLALCDLLFNVSHSLDHAQYAATGDHVRPPLLCAVYGFSLAEFIAAQNLLVTAVAVNACLLVYRGRPVPFGRGDWRLLLATFGLPFVFCTAVFSRGGFGPNGVFCYFDGVNGQVAKVFFTTAPLVGAIVLNGALYILTVRRLRQKAGRNSRLLGRSRLTRAAARTARTSLLFVVAFFVQWWAMAVFGVWDLVAAPPEWFFQAVTTFSNLGGVLNGCVFVIIRRRRAGTLSLSVSSRTLPGSVQSVAGALAERDRDGSGPRRPPAPAGTV